jgi:teichuronic acid biosynthesis glycosyltransferase TuaC
MRVAVVAEYYPRPDDPVLGVWAHRQALATRDAGAEVRVLVLDRPLPSAAALKEAPAGRPQRLLAETRAAIRRPRRQTLDGIDVEYVRFVSPPRETTYGRWHLWARRPLSKALSRGRRFDLVHAHYAHLAGAAALAWTKPRAWPLVVSVHGGDVLSPTLAGADAQATICEVLNEAAVVICNSRGTLRRAAGIAGRDEHMRVVHLGTDIPDAQDLPPKHEQPTIATLANVDPRKRHEDVLRALPLLPQETHWSVIGDGPARPALERLAQELGVAERVTFHGRLAPAQAHAELARAHVMALPSEDEAFGVAYVEALARGVPAIGCAGESGPEEIVDLGEGMLLVPPRDPPELAKTIERALADEGLPGKARATAAEHFTWERCGRETVAAYQAALER